MIVKKVIFCLIIVFLFGSCLGLSMDISMRLNGSGRIVMEYSVPSAMENIGRLDGNQNWPIIPVGRADWERTVSGIDGVRLVSFSSGTSRQEVITRVTLDFDSPETLARLLDPSGNIVTYSPKGDIPNSSSSTGALNIILNKHTPSEINPDLLVLFRQVSAGKKVSIGFSRPRGASSMLGVINGEGSQIPVPQTAQVVQEGRRVSFSIDTANIFDQADGVGVRLSW